MHAAVTGAAAPAPAPAERRRVSRAEALAVAAVTAAALALRLTDLTRSLFNDEAYSLALAQRGFGHMLGLFGYEANGTPYPIVLWPLIRVFGDAEAVLRAPAVVAGTAAVPAIWWAGRRYGGAAVGLVAASLLALNPMAVFYSQTARAYSFVVLAAALAFGTLPRALERTSRRGLWVGYVASMVLLAYSELLAAPLVLPAQALLVARAGPEARRRWLRALLALLALCIPLLVAAVIERGRRNALYWLPRPDRALVTLAAQEFTAGFSETVSLRWLTLAAGALLVAAAVPALRAGRRRTEFAVAACWGLLPGVLLLVASLATPLFYPRYAIVALPGLCLLGAIAAVEASRNRSGWVVAGCCVVLLAAAAIAADVRQRNALQENWPPAARFLAAREPGQEVLVDSGHVLPALGYYDPALRAANGNLIVPEWRDEPLPDGFVPFRDPGGYGTYTVGQPTAAEIEAAASRGSGTVWMVASEFDPELQGDPRTGPAVVWARAHCTVRTSQSLGVWVMHASGCPAGPAAAAPATG